MKEIVLLCLMLPAIGYSQQKPLPAGSVTPSREELESVLDTMDQASAKFKTAQADFQWDNYQKVVDETEKQTGQVYFRRNQDDDVESMFNIISPSPKQVLFKGDELMLYNPRIDQITEYKTGKNKGDVQAFLSLGFGARGHDLLKNYQVAMSGWETLDGVRTAKLQLTARSEKVRSMFTQFVLWIDPKQDVPIRLQVMQPSGDYWLAHYSGFKLGGKIPSDVFSIRKTPRTKVITPQ